MCHCSFQPRSASCIPCLTAIYAGHLSEKERKKAESKKRKAEAKAKAKKEKDGKQNTVAPETQLSRRPSWFQIVLHWRASGYILAAMCTGADNKDKPQETTKEKKDDDPDGEQLMRVADPLAEARKYLTTLQNYCGKSIATHMAACEVFRRLGTPQCNSVQCNRVGQL